jgi:hypothetical protein
MAGGYVTKLVNPLGEPTAINGETIQTWTMALENMTEKKNLSTAKSCLTLVTRSIQNIDSDRRRRERKGACMTR